MWSDYSQDLWRQSTFSGWQQNEPEGLAWERVQAREAGVEAYEAKTPEASEHGLRPMVSKKRGPPPCGCRNWPPPTPEQAPGGSGEESGLSFSQLCPLDS